jgi:competence protein ComEC
MLTVPVSPAIIYLLGIAGVCTWFFRRARPGAFLLLPMAVTLFAIRIQLDERLPAHLLGETIAVDGRIASLPVRRGDTVEFLFHPLAGGPGADTLPRRILVRWHDGPAALSGGEAWRLQLRLRPPVSRVNFAGPDGERYLFASRIGGLASVRGTGSRQLGPSAGYPLPRIRQQLRDDISSALGEHPGRGFVLALAIADRSALTREQQRVMTMSGTGHLLAISGLHVGLAATFGFWLARAAAVLWPAGWRQRAGLRFPWCCAIGIAAAYAALAGFGTSTQRALVMLLAVAWALTAGRPLAAWRALVVALVVVLMLDAMAPLRAGFWLSFGAVATLCWVFAHRVHRHGAIRSLARAQLAITLALMPLGMYWFQQGTVLGLLANIAAIPWVGLVVAPLVLGGVLLTLLGLPGAAALLELSADACGLLHDSLAWLVAAAPWGFRVTPQPALLSASVATLGCMLLLLPGGMRVRLLAPFLVAPLLLRPAPPAVQPALELLDVGQGLALLVLTRNHSLLYDTGPGHPADWDLVDSVLAPALAQHGRARPDRIVISHGDLDHAGGAATLGARYPEVPLHANLGESRIGCDSTLGWTWEGTRFAALHPDRGLPYLGNTSSCVLAISWSTGAILLTGDIDSAVEARLKARGIGRHPVLVAPHHGSRTSSSPALIETSDPSLVLISAGVGNRFGFPAEEVVARYAGAGARVVSTSSCGAIRVRFSPRGEPLVSSARSARKAVWRWPSGPGCPAN